MRSINKTILAAAILALGATPALACDPGNELPDCPIDTLDPYPSDGYENSIFFLNDPMKIDSRKSPYIAWRGLYIGLSVGAGLSEGIAEEDLLAADLGTYIGYNLVAGERWIWGTEIEASFSPNSENGESHPWKSRARLRGGYLFNRDTLLYGSFGAAARRVERTLDGNDLQIDQYGLSYGAGAERIIARNPGTSGTWMIRAEYSYDDYMLDENDRWKDWDASDEGNSHSFKAGLSYKF